MKIAGRLQDGGLFIQLSSTEAVELHRLVAATEGVAERSVPPYLSSMDNKECGGLFRAVRAFYETRFRVNELRVVVDGLTEFLSSRPPEPAAEPPVPVQTFRVTEGTVSSSVLCSGAVCSGAVGYGRVAGWTQPPEDLDYSNR